MTDKPQPRLATKQEVRDITFTPNDAVKLALNTIDARRTFKGVGVRIGIPPVDEYFMPTRPGDLITVMGLSSNYKSGLMRFWARTAAEGLATEEILDEAVVYITWEEAIEETTTFDLAATARLSALDIMQGRITEEQMGYLRTVAGTRRAVLPLYLIGHSIAEGKKRPHLTLNTVGQALMSLKQEFNIRPRIIFLDYLQRIDPGEGEDRRMQVSNNVDRCKDMALAMACPVVVGSQVQRNTAKERWGLPGISDGLETSTIEHCSDRMIGVWMPKTTHAVGTVIQAPGQKGQLLVEENTLLLRIVKQRMGPAGKWWSLRVDYAHNRIEAPDDVALNED